MYYHRGVYILIAYCVCSYVTSVTAKAVARTTDVSDTGREAQLPEAFDKADNKSSTLTVVRQREAKGQALGELFRAFGLEENTPEESSRRPDPPPFMLELYNSVADPSSGIVKMPSPFNANTIRSLPDKARRQRLHFQFNVSSVLPSETLLQAELHLFKLKPKIRPTLTGRRQPFYQIQLYQLVSDDITSLEGAKLIGLRLVGTVRTEWEVFSITSAVSTWISDKSKNFGVMVTITSLTGEPLDENFIRFAQEGKHHPSKHPILVLYTIDRIHSSGSSGLEAAGVAYDTFFDDYGNLNTPALVDSILAEPTTNMQTNRQGDAAGASIRQTRTTRQRRENLADTPPTGVSNKRTSKGTCSLKSMYVDFHEIGWSDWILYPVGYNAYECQGKCPFPLGQSVHPSNHATVQSLMHLIAADVAAPCCVPSLLNPIAVLFFDSDNNVVLKQFDNMVATSCGCR